MKLLKLPEKNDTWCSRPKDKMIADSWAEDSISPKYFKRSTWNLTCSENNFQKRRLNKDIIRQAKLKEVLSSRSLLQKNVKGNSMRKKKAILHRKLDIQMEGRIPEMINIEINILIQDIFVIKQYF